MQETPDTQSDPWVGAIPWRTAWQPSPVFWPGESHGQRSLAGYSLQGRKHNWSDLAHPQEPKWDEYSSKRTDCDSSRWELWTPNLSDLSPTPGDWSYPSCRRRKMNQVVSFYFKCGLSQWGDSHQQRNRSHEERPRETHLGNTKGTWDAGCLPCLWKMTPILNLSRNLVTYFFPIFGLMSFYFFISWSIYYYESLLKYSWFIILYSFQV